METERPEHQDSDFLGMPQPGQINYGNISNTGSNFTTSDIVIDSSMVSNCTIIRVMHTNSFQIKNSITTNISQSI